MSVQFVVDSGADTTAADRAGRGIHLVPLRVSFPDGAEFLDGVDITPPAFYARMAASAALPKTSMATAYDFAQVLEPIMDRGDEAVILTISGGVSGTIQSARLAAEAFPGRAFAVDTQNITCGIRVQLAYGMRLREQGLGAEQIARRLTDARERVRLVAVLETLENLKKGGRLSAAAAFAGGVLGIKPVVEMRDGGVHILGKARGMKRGLEQLFERIRQVGDIDFDMPVWTACTGVDTAPRDALLAAAADRWEGRLSQVPFCHAGSCIGTHAGPGVAAVAFYAKGPRTI